MIISFKDFIVENYKNIPYDKWELDMTIPPDKDMGKIFQNVPSDTAADWTREVIKYLNGELEMSTSSFIRQDNIKQKFIIPTTSTKLF